MQFTRSREIFRRAQQLIPGGVNSPARAFKAVGRHPLVMSRGQGAHIEDVDGNQYVDYVLSWGPLILGHAHPSVVEAVVHAARRGMSFGAPTAMENELAELIIEAVPSIERVRMVNSGTEASLSAIRLARAYTGRDRVIKFAGCYHGHVDILLVEAGSSATTLGTPSSPGVPKAVTAHTLLARFNDLGQVAELLKTYPGEVAAIVVEPVAGNMGVVPPVPGFLEGLRELSRDQGTLLVFDEVMTGFRVAYGGVQELLSVTPDLTILGKIIGGGLPVGAYGGPADIMDKLAPNGPVFQAGTLSGNPLAMAGGVATLAELRRTRPYERLQRLADRLTLGLVAAADQAGLEHQVAHVGSMITLFFNSNIVMNYEMACQCRADRFAAFFWGMLERGVYLPCSQFESAFLSTAHTEAHIDAAVDAAREALAEAAKVH